MKRFFPHVLAVIALAIVAFPPGALAEHSTHVHWTQLIHNTNDFGYWMTYFARQTGVPAGKLASPATVNANIARHIAIAGQRNLTDGARVGTLTGRMHLVNIPSAYRFHVDSYTDARALISIRWLFGSNPHTPISRLTWAFSPTGWKITGADFVRTS